MKLIEAGCIQLERNITATLTGLSRLSGRQRHLWPAVVHRPPPVDSNEKTFDHRFKLESHRQIKQQQQQQQQQPQQHSYLYIDIIYI